MKKAILLVSFLALTAVAPFVLGDAVRLGRLAFASFPAAAALNTGSLLWDTTNTVLRVSDGAAWRVLSDGPSLLTAQPVTGSISLTNLGGQVLPARAFSVSGVSFRVATAGIGGTTNATLRVTDGTNNCDAAFACNTATSNLLIVPTGTCDFAASASLTYSFNALGDCVTPPVLLGAASISGIWR